MSKLPARSLANAIRVSAGGLGVPGVPDERIDGVGCAGVVGLFTRHVQDRGGWCGLVVGPMLGGATIGGALGGRGNPTPPLRSSGIPTAKATITARAPEPARIAMRRRLISDDRR